jgi:hypothetical protein
MADNYLQFSFLLPLCGVSKVDAALFLKHWQDAKAIAMDDSVSFTEDNWDQQFNMDVVLQGEGEDLAVSNGDDAFWIYAEDFGSPEAAARFVYEFLIKFGIEGDIHFTWAETCSKMRIDQFSGGGCLINKNGYDFWTPGDFKSKYSTLN